MGADIPQAADYVSTLKPLLDRFGNDPALTVVVYTLDETTYSRELAPLAGHYPALRLGPPWWFFDSPEGMRRYYGLGHRDRRLRQHRRLQRRRPVAADHPRPSRRGPAG